MREPNGVRIFRRWLFCPLILAVLLYQGYQSIRWMHYQAARLAPIQQARQETGEWLQANADRSRWVLSGDIGSIAYHAPDFRFIDTIGLTSVDVLHAYRRGENLDAIIQAKNPAYIADTFEVREGELIWTHGNGAFVKNGKSSTIPRARFLWGKQFGMKLAIAIVELEKTP